MLAVLSASELTIRGPAWAAALFVGRVSAASGSPRVSRRWPGVIIEEGA